jgi:hypothetical protein
MLYGLDPKKIVRIEDGKLCYPAEIGIVVENIFDLLVEYVIPITEELFKAFYDRKYYYQEYYYYFEKLKHDLTQFSWKEEYLLPSIRLACLQILRILQEKLRSGSDLEELPTKFRDQIKMLPLPRQARIFLLDLDRVVGKSLQLDHGDYIISITPQMAYLTLKIVDPYNTSLILPPEEAPDGKTDYMLIKFVLNNALKNSLIVIEEPEIYKNPLFQFEMMDEISKLALDKNLTVVMTTHSEIIPLSIAKLVEVGKLKPDDVRIYYLTRSKEEPWTKIRKIDVYEDGTLEELPDSEKITAQLF